MSRGIILYQSKYGATKKYVDWLVEELGYDYVETKDAKVCFWYCRVAILKEKYRAIDRQEDCSICSWCFSI